MTLRDVTNGYPAPEPRSDGQIPQVPVQQVIGVRAVYQAKKLANHDGCRDRADERRADCPPRELRQAAVV